MSYPTLKQDFSYLRKQMQITQYTILKHQHYDEI